MLVYLLLPFIPVLFYLALFNRKGYDKDDDKSYKLLIGISLMTLILVSSFRSYNMGADYHYYVDAFLNDKSWHEQGFSIISKTVHSIFGNHYWGFALIISVSYLVPQGCFINKYCKNEYVLLVLLILVLNPYLYIQSTFNVVRQGMACGFLIIAYYLLSHKHYIWFGAVVLMSAAIHDISRYFWIFLLLVFLVRWNEHNFLFVSTICLLGNLFLNDFSFLTRFLSLDRFDSYFEWGDSLFNFFGFGFVIYILLIILITKYKELYENDDEKKWVDLYIFSLCFLLLAVKNDLIYRMYMMLAYISLPAVGIIFKNLKKNNFKYIQILTVGYVSYYVIMFILFLHSTKNNVHYIPFEFYKSK